MRKLKAILCDLDGTIADMSHRLHYIQGENKDYNLFYKDCYKDKPIENVINILLVYDYMNRRLNKDIDEDYTKIIFVTGRSDICNKETTSWIFKHVSCVDYELLMRKNGDYRKDYIIKKEIYENYIKDKYDILFVLEDRTPVVKMWRSLGLKVLQCDEGDF